MKTDTTVQMEKAIFNEHFKQGVFGCFEVTIGWFGKERVDFMTYNTKGDFRCFELKATKADFRSKAAHSFVGHFGYYVMPADLYDEVRADIPKGIGVYLCYSKHGGGLYARCEKKASRMEPSVDVQILKDSMIRSLARDSHKFYLQDDESRLERLKRENEQLRRDRDNYRYRNQDLQTELWELRHPGELDAI